MTTQLILVIDDSATTRKILEVCLGRQGYEVHSFADGITALRYLVQPGARLPDLLFLDLILPKMDGFEVIRCLKSKPACAGIPIVMLTSRNGVIDRLKGRLAGVNEYMTKPFKTSQIIQVVHELVGLHEEHRVRAGGFATALSPHTMRP